MKTGILNRATSAKATNEQKTAEEELKLGVSALSIDYRKNTTNSQTFREFVTSNSGSNLKTAMGLETTNTDLVVENGIVSYKGQKYQVDDYGGVAEYVPMWIQNKTQVSKDGVTLEVGQAVNGYSVTANIGGTETTVNNWYVLGAKDGKLLLTTNTNTEQVTLSGKDGYTGGVALLNSTAEKYTNLQFADGNARSINVDDINRVTGYDPDLEQYINNYNNTSQWKNIVTYELHNGKIYWKGTKYPNNTNNELGNESEKTRLEYWNGNEWKQLENEKNITLTSEFYSYYPTQISMNSNALTSNSKGYKLLFSNTGYSYAPEGAYWLATKYVNCLDGYAQFSLYEICGEYIFNRHVLFSSSNISESAQNSGFRPVVTLKNDVKVTKSGDTVSISI